MRRNLYRIAAEHAHSIKKSVEVMNPCDSSIGLDLALTGLPSNSDYGITRMQYNSLKGLSITLNKMVCWLRGVKKNKKKKRNPPVKPLLLKCSLLMMSPVAGFSRHVPYMQAVTVEASN